MTDIPDFGQSKPLSSDRELELEKLRLDAQLKIEGMRADVRKVVFGTMIVGIAAAFFPFAQEISQSWFAHSVEEIRKDAEIAILQEQNRLAEQLERRKFELEEDRQHATDIIARRDYLEQLAQEARSERIERQIITAEFFSFLGEPEMRPQWEGFRDYLISKQERLNDERSTLLTAVNNVGASASDKAAAIERLQQIERLQNPLQAEQPDYDLPVPPRTTGESELSRQMLEIAIAETNFGVHEVSKSDRVAIYWDALNLNFIGANSNLPWSAAFISWVIKESGNPNGLKLSAATINIWQSAKEKELTLPPDISQPVPGDIAFRMRRTDDASAWADAGGHAPGTAGIVYEVNDDEIVVIAGNISNAVRPIIWRRNDPLIAGFVRLPDPPNNAFEAAIAPHKVVEPEQQR